MASKRSGVQQLIINYPRNPKGLLVQAKRLDDGAYRILSLAKGVNGIGPGDIVEVREMGRSYPVVTRVVQRGPYVTMEVDYSSQGSDRAAIREALERFAEDNVNNGVADHNLSDKQVGYIALTRDLVPDLIRSIDDQFPGNDVAYVEPTAADRDFDPDNRQRYGSLVDGSGGSSGSGGFSAFLQSLFPWLR